MISDKDITTMRSLLLEGFPNYDEEQREKMLNDLLNRYSNPIPFCTMNGMNVARVGVRYELDNNAKGRYYYATEFDNELLDL